MLRRLRRASLAALRKEVEPAERAAFGRFLPRSALDPEAFVTREALKEGLAGPVQPRLLVLGTSTVAKVVESGADLQTRIADATGQDWRLIVLTLPRQSPTDQFALIDRALKSQRQDSPPVVVAVGFSPQRLRWTTEEIVVSARDRRIGLRSDWEDDEVRFIGGTPLSRSGLYPIENAKFVLLNGSRALLRLALNRPANRWAGNFENLVNVAELQGLRNARGDAIRQGFPDRDHYYAQISRLAANVAKIPNTRLVLIEETMSPDFIADQDLGDLFDQMHREIAELAANQGFEFWPVTTEAGLTALDYIDDIHLHRGAGQQKVREMIARHMRDLPFVKGAADGE